MERNIVLGVVVWKVVIVFGNQSSGIVVWKVVIVFGNLVENNFFFFNKEEELDS